MFLVWSVYSSDKYLFAGESCMSPTERDNRTSLCSYLSLTIVKLELNEPDGSAVNEQC